MSRKFEHSEIIHRPVNEVFAFLSNFENNSRWEPSVLESHKVSPEPMGIGTRLSEVRRFMGRKVSSNYEVTNYVPNQRFAVKSLSGPMLVRASYTFEAAGDGTRVTDTAEFETQGLFKLMEPLMGSMVQKQMKANFQKIRELLEAGAN